MASAKLAWRPGSFDGLGIANDDAFASSFPVGRLMNVVVLWALRFSYPEGEVPASAGSGLEIYMTFLNRGWDRQLLIMSGGSFCPLYLARWRWV